ncbi:hypothetical protein AB0L64_19805 [Kribbella sp. NPDC051936]|uniref:hypothetical protein n=1 Tax=Kribbella sp. NPDC051936 TaxID=3154946 RepID=UPI00344A3910
MTTEVHRPRTPSREALSDPAYIVAGSGRDAMYAVGVIEIVAGVAVALIPRYGALLVAAWLAGIILNLLTLSGFYDVALRDFGLLVAAIALARLAVRYAPARHGS